MERTRKDEGADSDSESSESEHELPTIPGVVRRKRARLRKTKLNADQKQNKKAYFGLGLSAKHQAQDDNKQGKGESSHKGIDQRTPLLVRHGVNEATQEITSLPRIQRCKREPSR